MSKKYEFDIERASKSLLNPFKKISMPKFPAMSIDGDLIFEDRIIEVEELEGELIKRNAQIKS